VRSDRGRTATIPQLLEKARPRDIVDAWGAITGDGTTHVWAELLIGPAAGGTTGT
jgi:hypothetical protein